MRDKRAEEVAVRAPVLVGDTDNEPTPKELRERWREACPEGGTRREEILRRVETLRWRAEQGAHRAHASSRLIDADLRGIDLSREDLSGIDLSGADLNDAILLGANLEGTVLYKSKLVHAELTGANLTGANLEQAVLRTAGLGAANLTRANLFGADLQGATLTQVRADGVDLRQACLQNVRAREADLSGADVTGANLAGADLSGTNVAGAVFNDADLRCAKLAGLHGYQSARWLGADVRDINWLGSYLVRRFIMDQNYIEEFRGRNRMSALVYRLWWLSSDCGRSLARWSGFMLLAILLFAGIYTFTDVDYGDHATGLSPLYFSVVTMTTLGYGDVLPASLGAQITAMVQVMIGYMGLGGMLAIFSSKLARRAD